MSDMITVKPAPGCLVRVPERAYRPLAEAGEAAPDSIDWHRRIAAGDVVLVTDPLPVAEPGKKVVKS